MTFEYITVEEDYNLEKPGNQITRLSERLKPLGKEGWELVTVIQTVIQHRNLLIGFLKRVKE